MTKRLLILLFVIVMASYVNAQNVVNYFSAGGDVCLPVTVKHSRGSFTFSSNNYRVDGPIDYVEAWDCQGRKILDTTPDSRDYSSSNSNSRTTYYYVFKTLYPESSSNNQNYSDSDNNYGSDNNNSYDGWDRLYRNVEKGSRIYDPGYPNFTMQAGISRVHGEFVRAKACLGGRTGCILYGGVGKDWIFDAKNEDFIGSPAKKKVAWHAGLGIYGGDLNGETATGEFALLIDYAETPMVKNGSLNIWLEGTWYFAANGHFGAFAGLGCSIGDLKKANEGEKKKYKYNFIFEIGLAYRIF